eukprot:gb/GECG01010273.1/.p1 GENE.gb/GECG01010273.1/~~gb/GECG01010273.1/.p1  ORF type:complete len:120 (+),score=9.58 gb/GECG01010273.1/:1-360(+)
MELMLHNTRHKISPSFHWLTKEMDTNKTIPSQSYGYTSTQRSHHGHHPLASDSYREFKCNVATGSVDGCLFNSLDAKATVSIHYMRHSSVNSGCLRVTGSAAVCIPPLERVCKEVNTTI